MFFRQAKVAEPMTDSVGWCWDFFMAIDDLTAVTLLEHDHHWMLSYTVHMFIHCWIIPVRSARRVRSDFIEDKHILNHRREAVWSKLLSLKEGTGVVTGRGLAQLNLKRSND